MTAPKRHLPSSRWLNRRGASWEEVPRYLIYGMITPEQKFQVAFFFFFFLNFWF